jgi:hypothetical protein
VPGGASTSDITGIPFALPCVVSAETCQIGKASIATNAFAKRWAVNRMALLARTKSSGNFRTLDSSGFAASIALLTGFDNSKSPSHGLRAVGASD